MIGRETWIRTIKDFQEFDLPEIIEREKRIEPDIPIKRAVSIIGPRRTGKTYFMYQTISQLLKNGIEKERILYINLEKDPLATCEPSDLRKLTEIFYEMYPENLNRKCYFFIDEIQNVPDWERFVRTIIDNENIQIFISGSSSKLLSKEVSTSMRGRSLPEVIYPFSFREFLRAKNFKVEKYLSSSKRAKLLHYLNEHLLGSYPEVVIYEREREKLMSEILDVTVYRDIIREIQYQKLEGYETYNYWLGKFTILFCS